ncbi:hypothetical protein FIBSPDRAFT_282908 [Athelia psychrophila]|uniref:Uncharacterized protein n=1 Tax=Athelia psychrophila TaxID=1759441 RepID=A0A166R3H0_9AGAM|nr:hypothetical protein FIBSPDRAFT_282908 [Fibularhizoctonia sp. CBS 109695]
MMIAGNCTPPLSNICRLYVSYILGSLYLNGCRWKSSRRTFAPSWVDLQISEPRDNLLGWVDRQTMLVIRGGGNRIAVPRCLQALVDMMGKTDNFGHLALSAAVDVLSE